MKTIVITGPSGSGKSYLSNKLSKLLNNSIVIKTDSYYKDNKLIRFLSIFLYDIYDRPFSIKKTEINKTLRSIHNNNTLISFYNYDFKKKHSSHSKKRIDYSGDKQFIILEGIFAHRLELNYQESINIVCEEEKDLCFKRRLLRDQIERGRSIRDVTRKFNRSWYLFYINIKKFLEKNQVICLKPMDENSYNELVINLKNIYNINNKIK